MLPNVPMSTRYQNFDNSTHTSVQLQSKESRDQERHDNTIDLANQSFLFLLSPSDLVQGLSSALWRLDIAFFNEFGSLFVEWLLQLLWIRSHCAQMLEKLTVKGNRKQNGRVLGKHIAMPCRNRSSAQLMACFAGFYSDNELDMPKRVSRVLSKAFRRVKSVLTESARASHWELLRQACCDAISEQQHAIAPWPICDQLYSPLGIRQTMTAWRAHGHCIISSAGEV
jgi:hypothetical protein